MRIVFLHGLESSTDDAGVPVGTKANYLRNTFAAGIPALDTTIAREVAAQQVAETGSWIYPFPRYEEAFKTPVDRARAMIGADTDVIVASSFGGAVAMKLLHESPEYRGALVLLASAGAKLTPYTSLPQGVNAIIAHGVHDDVVPFADSEALAATSANATLISVDDGHRLATIVNDDHLGRWVRSLLRT